MANRSWQNAGHFYAPHTMPILVDCNFVVDSANGNGLGIRSLKGPGVANVYMHTSATPAGGNPNPASGEIVVKLQDNYSQYFGGFSGWVNPVGASTTSSKANVINIITVLGTATLTQWQAVGLPVGQTPAVGVSFIGSSASLIGGSAQTAIALATGAGIDHIEAVGDSNLMVGPTGSQSGLAGIGATLYYRCYLNTTLTAPADGTVISLAFYLSNSSVKVQGE